LERGLVVDLGCGSGVLAEQLSLRGFDVLGIDFSPAMIALARQRVPMGSFRVESLLTADLPPCVAVGAVGECLNYLFDDNHSLERVRKVLERAFAALTPGGLLICDIAVPGRVPGPGPVRSWAEGKDWAVLVTTEEDKQQPLLVRKITSFRKMGDWYRRDSEEHRLRLLSPEQVLSWLEEIGFRARALAGYGPVPFVPGHIGFLAEKPTTIATD
jgi:SAM-dependent methyltransferase